MKKILFLLMTTLLLTSCEVEDDGPDIVQVLAEVTDADLPESFEQGKIYPIEITYLLPDACHTGIGLHARRGTTEAERRNIYVVGVASRPAGQEECTQTSEDLEVVESFNLRIDEDEPYTFYLWTGVDADGKDIYTQVVVPVGDEEPTTPEE